MTYKEAERSTDASTGATAAAAGSAPLREG
jgi:hypothetical protein